MEVSPPLLPLLPGSLEPVGVLEPAEMICQPLADWVSWAAAAFRSSSPLPPCWPWELLEFSLGDSMRLQVAASRASGDGCDSWGREEELRGWEETRGAGPE